MSINRHLARGIALQILFELDVNNNLSLNKEGLEKIIERQAEEFSGEKDDGFILDLLSTIEERVSTLDDIIARAAPEWPLEKINAMDRNILRIGLAELLFNSENVPPKVAIDEAIELAKNYSSNNSHKFVNGVLGSIYKEMGEPRKEEMSQKKNNLETINLAGGLVYSVHDGKVFLAFIKDIFKHWTLPKGKLLPEEDIMIGAVRKIKEEIGINVVIKDKLKENTYIANSSPKTDNENVKVKSEKVKKHVSYFLSEAKHEPLILEKENTGLLEAKWFSLDQIEDLTLYDDIKPIIAIGLEKINEIYENK
ncbi:MAG: transcription antitermination factor NusB [Candidatus Pacebacteria bacterium]|nr:transcription antitermination factor NusB [Candidatus Paceibacterota bacterium]